MKEQTVRIENDVFDVSRRLKEIDGDYFVVYNLTRGRFEVHHGRQRETLAVAVPFKTLDCRTVSRVLRTRVENLKAITAQIDADNLRLERNADEKILDGTGEKLKELVR